MDRRNLIKALMAGGVWGVTPFSSWAATSRLALDTTARVMIVGQTHLPYAAELATSMVHTFKVAGISNVRVNARGDELTSFSGVSAILDQAPNSRLIGVMDDAAALIFQELAASRGAAYVIQTHHRIQDQGVRHCCTSAGLDASSVWSGSIDTQASQISRLYAQTLIGRRLVVGSGEQAMSRGPAAMRHAASASLVSFLINT